MVEPQPSKLKTRVRFPSPAVLHSKEYSAVVAQSVEHVLGKDEVMSSNLINSFVSVVNDQWLVGQ